MSSLIKFKYDVKRDIADLIRGTFPAIGNANVLLGYLDERYLVDKTYLRHSSLYLACKCKFIEGDDHPTDYQDPAAIVAKNQMDAVAMYNSIYETDEGTTIFELERRCDDLEVEPI
jgi:hypothetical protein